MKDYMGLPLPRPIPPPGIPPICCSPCPDRGFFTVSSTDSSRQVASEAAVIALALTMAGSLEKAACLKADFTTLGLLN